MFREAAFRDSMIQQQEEPLQYTSGIQGRKRAARCNEGSGLTLQNKGSGLSIRNTFLVFQAHMRVSQQAHVASLCIQQEFENCRIDYMIPTKLLGDIRQK